MKYRDLKIGDYFLIPITHHIGMKEEDINTDNYNYMYKKTEYGNAFQFRKVKNNLVYITEISIPEEEDVIYIEGGIYK